MAKGQPALGLKLERGEPQKTGSSWELKVSAIVTRGNQPEPGVEVQFYLDKARFATEFSEDDGRALLTISSLTTGDHVIDAQITEAGAPLRRGSVRVSLKEDKPAAKRVRKLNLMQTYLGEKDGADHYLILFEALSDEGVRVSDAKIRISECSLTNGFIDLLTDKDGSAKENFTVSPKERKKILTITVLGEPIASFTRTIYSQKGNDNAF